MPAQLLKALSIFNMPLPTVTEVSWPQSSKVSLRTLTPSGILMDVSPPHLLNAYTPIEVTLSGIITEVIPPPPLKA